MAFKYEIIIIYINVLLEFSTSEVQFHQDEVGDYV